MLASLSIVVPVYNERERIARFLDVIAAEAEEQTAAAGLRFLETVVVDDGSADGTADYVRSRIADGRVRLVTLPANRGKGAVVAAGVHVASGDYSLITDVDLSTPLSELGRLTQAIFAGAEVAIGSRALDPALVTRSRYRHAMGRTYNLYTRRITGLPYRDTQCGFKLVRTDLGRALLAEQLVERYAFDVETLIRARAGGVRVDEVAVRWIQDGDSRVTPLGTAAKMALDTAYVAWRLRGGRGAPRAAVPMARADAPVAPDALA